MKKINEKLYSWASTVDPQVIDQSLKTSRLPFVYPHVSLMPDAHFGMGASVGSVIPTSEAVIPAAVGVDIGCGMIAVETQFMMKDLPEEPLSTLRHSIERSIPSSAGKYNSELTPSVQKRLDELNALAKKNYKKIDSNWEIQLGTLGSGNHFIEVCKDEADNLWLFLHSGSRGIGNKIAQYHIKKAQYLCNQWHIKLEDRDLAYLPIGTPEFTDYINDLHWAQEFARLNREEMMDRVIKDFGFYMGEQVKEVQRINTHHNFTKMEHHFNKNLWITRKGAVEATEGKLGLIPGSMGTSSYVVIGKGDKMSFCSSPHGAGRNYSRSKAKELFTLDDLKIAMKGIEYKESEAFIDEIPQAYKDIDQVMEDSKDLVEIKHTLKQILNVKGN